MKSLMAWILILWLGLSLECARPDVLPSGSLVMPLAVGCLFWFRDGRGVIPAGTALLLHWVLHPTYFPADGMAVLFVTAILHTRSRRELSWKPVTRGTGRMTRLMPFLVLLIGVGVHVFVQTGPAPQVLAAAVGSRMLIAMPALVAIAVVESAASSLGLRHNRSVVAIRNF